MNWQCASYSFDVKMPIVMGILNVTPDSFSDGGEHNTHDAAIAHAKSMIEQGAKVIDVGGESTRPGSAEVSVAEELSRTVEVVRELAQAGICVSIDTRHAEVARACVEAGAAIINDVSGFRDPAMVEVARSCDAGLVVMHMKGEPRTMQDDPVYDDVVVEVRDYLEKRAAELEAAGVAHDRICLDPGPGFGKTASQTMELIRNFHARSRVWATLRWSRSRARATSARPTELRTLTIAMRASAAEALMACELGAGVVRAHNVEATLKALKDLRPYCYLGLGCNVALVAEPGEEREGKIAQIEHAIGQLCMIPDSQIVDVSSYYESEPAYYLRSGAVRERRRAHAHGRGAEGAAGVSARDSRTAWAACAKSRTARVRAMSTSWTTSSTWWTTTCSRCRIRASASATSW